MGCSDSRVSPAIILQQKLGELFVVRVAGEVADDVVIDSIEYAVEHFSTCTLVVLGHSKCGAVTGALEHLRENGGEIDTQDGHQNAVLIPIERAILAAGINIYAPNALELSIKANVHYVAQQLLENSPEITAAVNNGTLTIIGAEYFLDCGNIQQLFIIKSA